MSKAHSYKVNPNIALLLLLINLPIFHMILVGPCTMTIYMSNMKNLNNNVDNISTIKHKYKFYKIKA